MRWPKSKPAPVDEESFGAVRVPHFKSADYQRTRIDGTHGYVEFSYDHGKTWEIINSFEFVDLSTPVA